MSTQRSGSAPGLSRPRAGFGSWPPVIGGVFPIIVPWAAAVGGSDSKAVPVKNAGSSPLRVVGDSVAIDGAGAAAFRLADLPVDVAQGETGQFSVEFRPPSAGSYAATLHVTVGDVAQTLALTGVAT